MLELGAGTGYHAALLGHLNSPHGHVTTMDVTPDLVERARIHRRNAGYGEVRVVCGDGAAGHPEGAFFNRIVATVGAFDISPAWLVPARPDRMAGGAGAPGRGCLPLRRPHPGRRLRAGDAQMCTFMPLRHSSATDPRRVLDLTGDESVTLQVNQDQDQDIPPEAGDKPAAGEHTVCIGVWQRRVPGVPRAGTCRRAGGRSCRIRPCRLSQ